jgi:hypothetical protein
MDTMHAIELKTNGYVFEKKQIFARNILAPRFDHFWRADTLAHNLTIMVSMLVNSVLIALFSGNRKTSANRK